jgi:hypothetical protein
MCLRVYNISNSEHEQAAERQRRQADMITLPTPRTAPEALRQARTAERAALIIQEGYSFFPDAELEMIAVCKPGFLHAEYWLTEGGKVCDCGDFVNRKDYCKHTIANSIVEANNIPTIASTNIETVRQFVADRDRAAALVEFYREEMEARESGEGLETTNGGGVLW